MLNWQGKRYFNTKYSRSVPLRKHYDNQGRFDVTPIGELMLNFDCRDEMIPVLVGLQDIYSSMPPRNTIVRLVAAEINENTRRDIGRRGWDDWQIVVLAAVRLGCDDDYDKM